MLEQDIELARLLLEKHTELERHGAQLREELQQAQQELSEAERVREERDAYLQVLSRAAQLLDRPDLEVGSPELDQLTERVRIAEEQLNQHEGELGEYEGLVDDLRSRAPQLLSAAAGDVGFAPEMIEATEEESHAQITPTETTATKQPSIPAGGEQEEGQPADSENQPTWSEDQEEFQEEQQEAEDTAPSAEPRDTSDTEGMEEGSDPAVSETQAAPDLEQRFVLKELKVKEAFTFGRGAAYVIDGTSVLDRIPHYDKHFRALSETGVRDELIRDIDLLSHELTGDFYIVFNSWHQPLVQYGNRVDVRHVTGDDEGAKPPADQCIRELIEEMIAQDRAVCVVTADAALVDSVSDSEVHIVALNEFFNT